MLDPGEPLVRTRYFWAGVARAALLGLFMGIVVLLYLGAEHAAIAFLWPDEIAFDPFEGPGIALFVLPVGGLLVALLYRLFKLPPRLPSFIDELAKGRVEPKQAPGVVLVGLTSLISGASIGPEAPLASAGGGSGTYLAERSNPSTEKVSEATYAGVSGAFGGLMTSPFLGTMLGLELQRPRAVSFVITYLVPGIVSATVAFVIVYPISGNTFLGIYQVPGADFELWHLAAGAGLGLVGGVAGIMHGLITRLVAAAALPLNRLPVLKPVVGGLFLAIIAIVLPLTLFSGVEELEVVLAHGAEIGAGLLLLTAVAKMIAVAVTFGTGFYGGPIFPLMFIGGTIGTAVHLLVPDLPMLLSVAAVTAAVPAALAPIPLSMILITLVVFSIGPLTAAAVGVAAVVAFLMGFGLVRRVRPERG